MFIIFILSEDEAAVLETLYINSWHRLIHVAEKYLGQSNAEDAVHDVFEKLLKRVEGNIDEICDKEEIYFVIIVKNHCIDVIRKESKEPIYFMDEEDIFVDESSNPFEIIFKNNQLDALTKLIQQLKPAYREILEYRYILGYDNSEIASQLDISASLVATRLERARKKLKLLISERREVLDG